MVLPPGPGSLAGRVFQQPSARRIRGGPFAALRAGCVARAADSAQNEYVSVLKKGKSK